MYKIQRTLNLKSLCCVRQLHSRRQTIIETTSFALFQGQQRSDTKKQDFQFQGGQLSNGNTRSMATTTNAVSDEQQQQPTGVIAVYVTVPDMETGKKIASKLVETKLAACVNIIPGLTSVYWWDNKVNEDPELLLMIKSQKNLLENLTKQVQKLHPYDECEVIATDIVGGSQTYLNWVIDSTKDPKPDL
eukprot:TRINITY_DN6324_c0_g1_i10.p1 TRINITY_DN6324_c0_g1~~TRINITY_DN6324_c0_g1_i10.p1  ORF type:complete len:189 (+),score=9.46 TRINITY_DN6324_c0_g1_i10:95-661(+)